MSNIKIIEITEPTNEFNTFITSCSGIKVIPEPYSDIKEKTLFRDTGSLMKWIKNNKNINIEYDSNVKKISLNNNDLWFSLVYLASDTSLQIYLAAILDKFQNSEEVGDRLRTVNSMKDIQLKFILVVKNAEDITWLAGPLAELKARLLQIRKIWGVEIAVLNEELAGEYKLTCSRPICGAVTEIYPQR